MAKKRDGYIATNVGVITIGDTEYTCENAVTMFQLSAIPMCKAMVGPRKGTRSQNQLYQALNKHTIGDPVEVTFTINGSFVHSPSNSAKRLENKEITIFKGYFLGWSPVSRSKSIESTVWVMHDTGRLDWSSTMSDDLHGIGMSDHRVKTVVREGDTATPYMPGLYGTETVEDVWGKLIKPEFIHAAESSRFGRPNSAAIEALNSLDLSDKELPLSLQVEYPNRAIVDIRRTVQSQQGGLSLWDKLVYLADKYLFAVSPRIHGFSVIPFSALIANDAIPLLDSSEFVAENNVITYLSRVFRDFGLVEESASFSSAFDVVTRKSDTEKLSYEIVGLEEGIGAIGHYKAPPWLQIGNAASYRTKRTTGVGGSVMSVGYTVEDDEDAVDEETMNALYNSGGSDGERYAQALANDLRFKTRVGYLRSSLRFDLAPGSQISVGNPIADKDSPAYFATVHTVCTSWLVHPNTTGTWIILDNIRTAKEQELVSNEKHPLYNNAWIRAPILDPEAAGLSAHIDDVEVG